MVRIMLTGGSKRDPPQQHDGGTPSSLQSSPTRCQGREEDKHGFVGEDVDDARQAAFGERSADVDGSCWSNALVVVDERGAELLPRDSSTCILWCAVALGALVRGHPIAQVRAFFVIRSGTHTHIYRVSCLLRLPFWNVCPYFLPSRQSRHGRRCPSSPIKYNGREKLVLTHWSKDTFSVAC